MAGDTWHAVESALKRGARGLPGGGTLRVFLARHGRRNDALRTRVAADTSVSMINGESPGGVDRPFKQLQISPKGTVLCEQAKASRFSSPSASHSLVCMAGAPRALRSAR